MCQRYASIRSHQKYSPAWPSTSKLNYRFLHSHLSSCLREPNVHSLVPEPIPHVLFSADWESKAAGRSLTEVRMGHWVPFCAHDTIITSPQLSLVPSRLQAPPGQRPGATPLHILAAQEPCTKMKEKPQLHGQWESQNDDHGFRDERKVHVITAYTW